MAAKRTRKIAKEPARSKQDAYEKVCQSEDLEQLLRACVTGSLCTILNTERS